MLCTLREKRSVLPAQMVRRKRALLDVGERVIRNYVWLRRLARTKSHARRLRLVADAGTDQLLALVEVAANLIRRRFPLSIRQRERLAPFAQAVRSLARARSEKTAKRLVQKGAGGPLLASLLVPVLLEAARHLISPANGS